MCGAISQNYDAMKQFGNRMRIQRPKKLREMTNLILMFFLSNSVIKCINLVLPCITLNILIATVSLR